MKTSLNILLLLTFFSFTNYLTANEGVLNGYNSTILEGDTTIMQEQGTQLLTDCAGVILDPGGYGDYQNGILSIITIEALSTSVVSLFFSEFHIENTFDDFYIYDGSSQSAPLIGLYDNTDLLGQTINSSGGPLTIVFVTDNSVFRSGFVIDYLVAGGGGIPVANFETAQSSPIPLNSPVSFIDLSQNAGSWSYDFGDDNQSTEQNPLHTFTEPGTYDVNLTITNCIGQNTYTQTVIVQEAGQLEINPQEICVTLNSFMTTTVQVNLTNSGIGDLYYDFTEINNENPNALTVILGTGVIPPGGIQSVNLFFSAGELLGGTYDHNLLLQTGDPNLLGMIYPVKMIVVGIPLITVAPNSLNFPDGYLGYPQTDSICITNLGTDTLHISNISTDTPGFSVNPTELSVPPGGEVKTQVTLLAEEAGVFSGMISISSNASSTVVVPVFGEIIDPPVGIFSPDNICLNLAQDESTLFIMGINNEGGEILIWNFAYQNTIPEWLEIGVLNGVTAPNGSQSVPVIVNATGLAAGEYEYNATIFTNDPILGDVHLNVKLTVIAPPVTSFFAIGQNSCDGIISFIDISQGEIATWLWDFGDNTFSQEQNPTHIYEETGIYDVSLIACNPVGCDTLELENLINYSEYDGFCDTLLMGILGDTTVYNCNGYIYDSGGLDADYAENSNYTITISPPNATSINLNFDEFELELGNWDLLYIYAGPDNNSPLIGSYSGTDAPGGGNLLVLSNSVTLQFISDSSIEKPGFAMSYSCTLPATVANFTANIDTNCSNEIEFINNSEFGISYSWDFGDGSSSNDFAPTHIYNSTGNYEISLIVENNTGTNTVTETVQVSNLPFDLDINIPSNIYLNNFANFSYSSSTNLSQVEWTTNSGGVSNLDTPEFIFSQIGEVEVTLTGTDIDGCQVTTSELIFVEEVSKISDAESISSFKVFPVPTGGIINIDLSLKEKSAIRFALFNTMGQQLYEEEFQSILNVNKVINLSRFPRGTYILGIWLNGDFAARRRVVLAK